jgi:hypothetical protein
MANAMSTKQMKGYEMTSASAPSVYTYVPHGVTSEPLLGEGYADVVIVRVARGRDTAVVKYVGKWIIRAFGGGRREAADPFGTWRTY